MRIGSLVPAVLIVIVMAGFSGVSALEGCHQTIIMGKTCCAPGLNWGEGGGLFWCPGDTEYEENCKSCIGTGTVTPTESAATNPTAVVEKCEGSGDSGARFSSISRLVEVWPEKDPDAMKFANERTILQFCDHVATGEKSISVIAFSDLSSLMLKPESEIVISPFTEKKSSLELVTGSLLINFKKIISGEAIEVRSQLSVTGIKGTTLVLENTEARTTIKVIEGNVDFTSTASGKTINVGSGEMVSATSEGLSDKQMFDVDEELNTWRNLGVDTSDIFSLPGSKEEIENIVIFDNWNNGGAESNPSCNPSFEITQPNYISYIDTYHYNLGQGVSAGGTISLRRDDGEIFGPWTVSAESGSGAANAWWICHPNVVIPAGTYTIIDSEPETWSKNSESNDCGFSKVEGHAVYSASEPESTQEEGGENLLYSDDFSDVDSGWSKKSSSPEESSVGYEDGEYQITVFPKGLSWSAWLIRSFNDFELEVEATPEEGSDENDYGVVLRHSDDGYYRFKIFDTGFYGFEKWQDGQWTDIIPWTKSDAINTGKSTNLIKVACHGDEFTLYVNDIKLGDCKDNSFSSGDIGLFVATHEAGGSKVSFDNLKIWGIGMADTT